MIARLLAGGAFAKDPARPITGRRARFSDLGRFISLFLVLLAVFGPMLAPYDPNLPDYTTTLSPPSVEHLLGTDASGRDQFSRILDGASRSLGGAMLVVFVAVSIGAFVGTSAALGGPVVDVVIMRFVDMLLAIPGLIFAFVILGLLGPGYFNLLLALALGDWPYFARIARISARRAVLSPTYEASRIMGVPAPVAVIRHVLPVTMAPLLVLGTLGLGGAIAAISSFSYLGLGVAVPKAEWGAMLADSRFVFTIAPWLLICPAVMIFLSVLGANLLGEALRKRLLPEARS